MWCSFNQLQLNILVQHEKTNWLNNRRFTDFSALLQSGFGVSYIYHHFYLKPTTCPKGTTDTNAQRCRFRNDRVSKSCLVWLYLQTYRESETSTAAFLMFAMTLQPLMDCAVCYKALGDHIEAVPNPYVHCIQKPRLTGVLLLLISFLCSEEVFLHTHLSFQLLPF